MPCNLAVSITKAAVSNEQLVQLLTPEAVYEAVKTFLSRHDAYKDQLFGDWQSGSALMFYVGDCIVTILGAQVTVNGSEWSTQQAETLSADMNTLLARLADYLFAQQVQQALAGLGPVESQTMSVDDQGVTRQATVFTLNI